MRKKTQSLPKMKMSCEGKAHTAAEAGSIGLSWGERSCRRGKSRLAVFCAGLAKSPKARLHSVL